MNSLRTHVQAVLFLSLSGLILISGCSGSLFETARKTPQELLQEAVKFIRVENFDDAKKALNKVLEDYPDSPERVTASLLLAEVHYKNGQYEEAKFMFKGFLELYPAHRLADRAHYHLAMSDYRLIDLETRDQTATQNALEEFDDFLKKFPKSKYRPKALARKRKCLESLARNQMEIGKFYFRTSSFQSAIVRFQQLMEAYPDQPFLDEVMFLLAESYYNEQNFNEARLKYKELIDKFPRSEFVKEARMRLREIQ